MTNDRAALSTFSWRPRILARVTTPRSPVSASPPRRSRCRGFVSGYSIGPLRLRRWKVPDSFSSGTSSARRAQATPRAGRQSNPLTAIRMSRSLAGDRWASPCQHLPGRCLDLGTYIPSTADVRGLLVDPSRWNWGGRPILLVRDRTSEVSAARGIPLDFLRDHRVTTSQLL